PTTSPPAVVASSESSSNELSVSVRRRDLISKPTRKTRSVFRFLVSINAFNSVRLLIAYACSIENTTVIKTLKDTFSRAQTVQKQQERSTGFQSYLPLLSFHRPIPKKSILICSRTESGLCSGPISIQVNWN